MENVTKLEKKLGPRKGEMKRKKTKKRVITKKGDERKNREIKRLDSSDILVPKL
jgi:hypothetical protein